MFFFSQTGDYQKAFEHLGNVLTYDPGNYKVWWGVQMNPLNYEGTPPKANSTVWALHLHLGPGEARKDPAQRGFCEIHFWNVSLGRELDVFGGREREGAEYGMFNWCFWFLIWSCSKARWNLLWKEDLLDFKNPRTVPGPLWSKCCCILLFSRLLIPCASSCCGYFLGSGPESWAWCLGFIPHCGTASLFRAVTSFLSLFSLLAMQNIEMCGWQTWVVVKTPLHLGILLVTVKS